MEVGSSGISQYPNIEDYPLKIYGETPLNHYHLSISLKDLETYSSQIEKIPRSTWHRNEKFTLPDKFVTAQWDAQQIYRDVRKYDKDKADKIEQKYIDEGYEIIRVGGEGEYKRLIDIMYLMQRADYHIGAESGMMHLAKFFMDCDRLHIYRNIQRREEQRFPDGWDVSWMGREMLRRGMRLNLKYEYNKEQEEYFKDVSVFHDK